MTKAKPLVEVRKSSVHGSGVFALRRIKKGDRILMYAGAILSNDEVNRQVKAGERDPSTGHTFLMSVDDDHVIDGAQGGNESRMINHSCDPNVEFGFFGGRRPWVYALRDLKPGEELLLDYALESIDGGRTKLSKAYWRSYRCRCDAWCCRGTMFKVG